MLMPSFSLSQTPDSLIINVRAPYCNVGELETDVSDDCFTFACFPYYLQFTLPGSVREYCEIGCSYCFITEEFEFMLEKRFPGEEFKDLDIYPKLLIGAKPAVNRSMLLEEGMESCCYGFAMKGNKPFSSVAQEFSDIFDIDPTLTPLKGRRVSKLIMEQSKFKGSHYLADLHDEEKTVLNIIEQTSPWKELKHDDIDCSVEEENFFKNHPKTISENALTPLEQTYCLNGLIDILFAYCYDQRTTYFEGTCESSWTISKLAATLCCFYAFQNARDVIISAFRRSLIYPLYRNFALCETVFEDLKDILRLKRKFVIKCLLHIYDTFLNSQRYILNTLYINDYIHYVNFSKEDLCDKALCELEKIKINKSDLGLNLYLVEEVGGIATYANYTVVSNDSDDTDSEAESIDA